MKGVLAGPGVSPQAGRRWLWVALIAVALYPSWLAMMAVHECGHVLNCWATGGKVLQVVLEPLELSRTDYVSNPHPAVVAWGGVIWGSLLPLVLALAVPGKVRAAAMFFAGFCLVANGAYLTTGVFTRVGDAGALVDAGQSVVLMLTVGVVLWGGGLYVWHRLGSRARA